MECDKIYTVADPHDWYCRPCHISKIKLNNAGVIFKPCGRSVWTIQTFDLTHLQFVTDYLPLM